MSNMLAHAEVNLGRAGWTLSVTLLGSVAAAMALGAAELNRDLGLLLFLVGCPVAAWFMSRAAKAQGRSPLLYGLAGLIPPLAVLAIIKLYTRDLEIRLAQKYGPGQDA